MTLDPIKNNAQLNYMPSYNDEKVIDSVVFDAEMKKFTVELRSNKRGKFVKIREECKGGRFDMVIIPEEGIAELAQALAKLAEKL